MTLELELRPVPGKPGRYMAMLGEVELCRSTQPFLTAARALLAEGYASDLVLEARHAGSPIVALRSTIGEAARWMIEETDRGGLRKRRWRPFRVALSPGAVAPRSADPGCPGTSLPPRPKRAPRALPGPLEGTCP